MRTRSVRPRWIPVLAVTLVLVVLVAIGYAAWTFGGLDPRAIPARLRIYGRTYRATESADLTAAEVAAACPLSPCLGSSSQRSGTGRW